MIPRDVVPQVGQGVGQVAEGDVGGAEQSCGQPRHPRASAQLEDALAGY